MTFRLLLAGMRHRIGHLLVLSLAAAVAAALLVTASGVSRGVADVADTSFDEFGPNLLVRPQVAGELELPLDAPERILTVDGVEGAAGVSESSMGTSDRRIVVSEEGLLDLHPQWELEGRWPASGEALVGREVAASGRPHLVAVPSASADGAAEIRPVSGVIVTGDDLDRAVVLDFSGSEISGFDRVEVRADSSRLDRVAAAIEAAVPGAEVRSLARVTVSEAGLSRRLSAVLAVAGVLTLVVAGVIAAGVASALVTTRRGEAALLESLGAAPRQIGLVLLGELALASVLAAAAGALGGRWLTSELLGRLTGDPVGAVLSGSAVVLAAVVVLAVMLVAASRSLGGLRRLEPALVLRERSA